MELIEKAYYDAKFENAYLKARGNEFQTFFDNLMGRAFKADYMPSRPWGKQGDKKNDGFLKSEKRLFQVYAPNEMSERDAIKKIDEDFDGAKKHWGQYFNKWSFVHNAYDGLPPHIHNKILELEKNNQGIKLEPWGFPTLLEIFHKLSRDEIENWFGYAPNSQAKANVKFDEIKVVLESIEIKTPDSGVPVKQVPPKKIEANQLSDSIAVLLKEGMVKSSLVDDFFTKWHDPTFGESVASAFRSKYAELQNKYTPNEIFFELQSWVGGKERGTPEHEMAVLTIMAYYFESCDIFEEPRN